MATVDALAPAPSIARSRALPAARWWFQASICAAAAVTFVALQTWLRVRGWNTDVARMQAAGVIPRVVRAAPVAGSLRGVVADSGGVYLALLVSALVLARRGPRWSIAIPLLCWTAIPLVAGIVGPLGPGSVRTFAPAPIGAEWIWLGAGSHTVDVWLGAAVDAALVLLPAFVFATSRRSPADGRRSVARSARLAAAGLGLFGLWLVVELPRLYGVPAASFLFALAAPAAVFAFGALVDEHWRWRWPVVIAVAVVATNNFAQWVVWGGSERPAMLARDVAPFVIAAAAGAAIAGGTRLFAHLDARPIAALIACNVLNAGDALLTAVGVRGGLAVETNPVVRMIGLPSKLVLVALLSVALLRTRPRALVWPCAALAGVIVWHCAGFLAGTPLAWWQ
jgi:hypothetical protein